MEQSGGDVSESKFTVHLEHIGFECLRARARCGYLNSYFLAITGMFGVLLMLSIYWLSSGTEQALLGPIIFYFICVAGNFGSAMYFNWKFHKHGSRSIISNCSKEQLSQVQQEIAASRLIPALLSGNIRGREHLELFPFSTRLHINITRIANKEICRAIDNVSYNCKWYVKRRGMCREHADILPYVFFWINIVPILIAVLMLDSLVSSWVSSVMFLTLPIGMVVMIILRMRINSNAGCYELAFYDELAKTAMQLSAATSQDEQTITILSEHSSTH